jgi:peptidoglycan LD-endopeptidase CwlK
MDKVDALLQVDSRALNAFSNFFAELDRMKVPYYISEAKRELVRQMAYYSRGRMSIEDVQAMYKAAGLYKPTISECNTKITWTLDSPHIKGFAIDIYPKKADGTPDWGARREAFVWGSLADKFGLEWGGNWKGKEDLPHIQLKGWEKL